jgi:hypothetical protein
MYYRRNSDAHLRELERQVALEGWPAKLVFNQTSILRYGRIPDPDVEIKATWDSYYLEDALHIGNLIDGPSTWVPSMSDYQTWYRRWHFPNGFGVAATYNAHNPRPGWAAAPTRIPPEEHELEAIAFKWVEDDGTPKSFVEVGHHFGRLIRRHAEGYVEQVDIISYPKDGAPDHTFWGMVTPRFRLDNDEMLLEVLHIVAQAEPGATQREIWNGTGWDWWNED